MGVVSRLLLLRIDPSLMARFILRGGGRQCGLLVNSGIGILAHLYSNNRSCIPKPLASQDGTMSESKCKVQLAGPGSCPGLQVSRHE
jgi:hypothetical protein